MVLVDKLTGDSHTELVRRYYLYRSVGQEYCKAIILTISYTAAVCHREDTGKKYTAGETFTLKNCSQSCMCNENGQISCVPMCSRTKCPREHDPEVEVQSKWEEIVGARVRYRNVYQTVGDSGEVAFLSPKTVNASAVAEGMVPYDVHRYDSSGQRIKNVATAYYTFPGLSESAAPVIYDPAKRPDPY
ncbi:TEL2-interacting protein 2 [Desmophyllum pertusum]|uniref:TEL2-interacting protein 2 n=1 Tax=Desmophyllum pertusum TaxID=174260 RepID=A0A9X0CXK0_9CNID|nr:TEL2-interacting protein 2 [Desmophyllum pertusum]